MKIWGLIQARMGSTRLPGKVMKPLAGHPLIWHVGQRLGRVKGLTGIVLATTTDPRNDPMVAFAETQGWQVVRHSVEDDVAGRLTQALEVTGADAFLKVNGDCPIPEVSVLETLVEAYQNHPELDVVTNKKPLLPPLGLTAELVSKRAILWCERHLVSPEDRELTLKYVLDRPEQFPSLDVKPIGIAGLPADLMIDTADDYAAMSALFDVLYPKNPMFGLADICAHLQIPLS